MTQEQLDALNAILTSAQNTVTTLEAFIAANPLETAPYVPTEAEVQAAVDAGVISAFTPASAGGASTSGGGAA